MKDRHLFLNAGQLPLHPRQRDAKPHDALGALAKIAWTVIVGTSVLGLVVSICLLVISHSNGALYDCNWPDSAWISCRASKGSVSIFCKWLGAVDEVAAASPLSWTGATFSVGAVRSEMLRLRRELVKIDAESIVAARTKDPFEEQMVKMNRNENLAIYKSFNRDLDILRQDYMRRADILARNESFLNFFFGFPGGSCIIRFPAEFPVVMFSICPIVSLCRYRRQRVRRRTGCCLTCGYNLYQNARGICPECGTPIPEDQRSRTEKAMSVAKP